MAKRLLIIDDDDDFVYLTRRRLARHGWVGAVDSVSDGDGALTYFRACLDTTGDSPALPDLVLVDINMPGMGGFELMPALDELLSPHKARIGLPPPFFMMVTSSQLAQDRERALRCPLICGFVSKPVRAEALAAILGIDGEQGGV